MTFEKLQIGDYFRIPGISFSGVYRKASVSQCSLNALLQPIRRGTPVMLLSRKEVKDYFAAKYDDLNMLMNLSHAETHRCTK
nr:hypothetical protein [Fortiea contorta]